MDNGAPEQSPRRVSSPESVSRIKNGQREYTLGEVKQTLGEEKIEGVEGMIGKLLANPELSKVVKQKVESNARFQWSPKSKEALKSSAAEALNEVVRNSGFIRNTDPDNPLLAFYDDNRRELEEIDDDNMAMALDYLRATHGNNYINEIQEKRNVKRPNRRNIQPEVANDLGTKGHKGEFESLMTRKKVSYHKQVPDPANPGQYLTDNDGKFVQGEEVEGDTPKEYKEYEMDRLVYQVIKRQVVDAKDLVKWEALKQQAFDLKDTDPQKAQELREQAINEQYKLDERIHRVLSLDDVARVDRDDRVLYNKVHGTLQRFIQAGPTGFVRIATDPSRMYLSLSPDEKVRLGNDLGLSAEQVQKAVEGVQKDDVNRIGTQDGKLVGRIRERYDELLKGDEDENPVNFAPGLFRDRAYKIADHVIRRRLFNPPVEKPENTVTVNSWKQETPSRKAEPPKTPAGKTPVSLAPTPKPEPKPRATYDAPYGYGGGYPGGSSRDRLANIKYTPTDVERTREIIPSLVPRAFDKWGIPDEEREVITNLTFPEQLRWLQTQAKAHDEASGDKPLTVDALRTLLDPDGDGTDASLTRSITSESRTSSYPSDSGSSVSGGSRSGVDVSTSDGVDKPSAPDSTILARTTEVPVSSGTGSVDNGARVSGTRAAPLVGDIGRISGDDEDTSRGGGLSDSGEVAPIVVHAPGGVDDERDADSEKEGKVGEFVSGTSDKEDDEEGKVGAIEPISAEAALESVALGGTTDTTRPKDTLSRSDTYPTSNSSAPSSPVVAPEVRKTASRISPEEDLTLFLADEVNAIITGATPDERSENIKSAVNDAEEFLALGDVSAAESNGGLTKREAAQLYKDMILWKAGKNSIDIERYNPDFDKEPLYQQLFSTAKEFLWIDDSENPRQAKTMASVLTRYANEHPDFGNLLKKGDMRINLLVMLSAYDKIRGLPLRKV